MNRLSARHEERKRTVDTTYIGYEVKKMHRMHDSSKEVHVEIAMYFQLDNSHTTRSVGRNHKCKIVISN